MERPTIGELLAEAQVEADEYERREAAHEAVVSAKSTEGQLWAPLLARIRIVDKGPGQTFGLRWVAKIEGFEIARARRVISLDEGCSLHHYAAALLHAAGVRADTPIWDVKALLAAAGIGPPYDCVRGRETRKAAETMLEGF